MTLAKAKAKTNETFIVQASLTIVTYDRQNMFIVQAIVNIFITLYFLFNLQMDPVSLRVTFK
jgi:hypothetical protein